jgi:hypothetical protein
VQRIIPCAILLIVSAISTQAFAQTTGRIDQWIQAESFSAKQGGQFVQAIGSVAEGIQKLGGGNWVRFDNVNFAAGEFDSVALFGWWWDVNLATDWVRIRLDSPTASPIASMSPSKNAQGFPLPSTGITVKLAPASGVHTLYVTIEGTAEWFRFDKIRLSGTITASATDAKTYYVAADGSDGNDGLSIDKPFRTIQKAASIMKPGSTCKIRQGIYRETIKPVYSGIPGAPLTFEAFNGEIAVISGADPITGWTLYSGNIYKAPMGWSLGEYLNQVLVDGKMAWIAQCPNVTEPLTPDTFGCWGRAKNWEIYRKNFLEEPLLLSVRACMNQPSAIIVNFPPGTSFSFIIREDYPATQPLPRCLVNRPTNFFKGALLNVNNVMLSGAIITGSNSVSATQTTVTAASLSSMLNNNSAPGWISHLFDLLDSPNEWFYKDGILYLWAPDGGDPSHHLVEAKKRLLGFDLRGKQYVNVTEFAPLPPQ